MIDLMHKTQNVPVPYPTMLHSEQKCTHKALWDIEQEQGFVKLVYSWDEPDSACRCPYGLA